MFRSYLLIAFRNILRRRFYSIINLLGLSVGLVSTLVVIILLRHEFSYDTGHPFADRTYRLIGTKSYGTFPTFPIQYSNPIQEGRFPEVEDMTRVRRWPSKFLKYQNEKFYEEKILITDPGSSFFKVFNFELAEGDRSQVLSRPNTIVISQQLADKYFKGKTALGEIMQYDTMSLTVSGVMKDIPSNSHLAMNALITNAWAMDASSGAYTYCVLYPHADVKNFVSKLMSIKVDKDSRRLSVINLQPLTSIHFDSNLTFELKNAGNRMYILLFAAIGMVVLLITIINYVNLSIATYAERTKEIAVRKMLGGNNSFLSLQIISEALLVAMLSLPVTVMLSDLALPWMNFLLQVDLGKTLFQNPENVWILVGLTLAVGVLAGAYPAFAIPRYKTVSLFKGAMTSRSGLSLRQKLILVQFTLLVTLGGCSWMIFTQLNFIQNRQLGFDKDHVLKLSNSWNVDSIQYVQLKAAFLNDPEIISVSTGIVPGDDEYGFPFRTTESEEVYDDLISINSDFDFLKTMDIKIIRGNLDLKNLPRRAFLINETMAKRLRYSDPVGKSIIINPGTSLEATRIIDGVFNDFHFFSLHKSISPQALSLRKNIEYVNQNILIRIKNNHLQPSTAKHIQHQLNTLVPNEPVRVKYLSDDIDRFYTQEQSLGALINCLLTIAFVTSFIGLIGFTSYLAELRTKEIGIRKVLGATSESIVLLLTRSFFAIVAVSAVIGAIAAYFLSESWLKIFSYKTALNFYPFMIIGCFILVISLIITGLHSFKASLTSPSESLKSN